MNPKLRQLLNFFKISSKENLGTSQDLFKLKRYCECLFFGHLAVEKLLKGLVIIKTNKIAPFIHNLEKLAKIAVLELTVKQVKTLRTITDFNLATRYEDWKMEFHKRCTQKYTKKHLKIIEETYQWLEKKYPKN